LPRRDALAFPRPFRDEMVAHQDSWDDTRCHKSLLQTYEYVLSERLRRCPSSCVSPSLPCLTAVQHNIRTLSLPFKANRRWQRHPRRVPPPAVSRPRRPHSC